MAGSQELRLVLLGKTGSGKSSFGNLILGKPEFQVVASSPNSTTPKCKAGSVERNGKNITVVDTPGFYDTRVSDENLKAEVIRCITECAPGAHAFIIVLKVETFTEQELDTVKKIEDAFGEVSFKHAIVLFTHGDNLDDEVNIEEFVGQSEELKRFVDKCGNRCQVIDNKYWKSNEHEYRNNTVQVEELMKTIEQMVEHNGGGYYTNELLQMVEQAKQAEMAILRQTKAKLSEEELTREAKETTWKKLWKYFAGVSTGVIIGAFLGGVAGVSCQCNSGTNILTFLTGAITGVVGGAAIGGYIGYAESTRAETAGEAAKQTAENIWEIVKSLISRIDERGHKYRLLKN